MNTEETEKLLAAIHDVHTAQSRIADLIAERKEARNKVERFNLYVEKAVEDETAAIKEFLRLANIKGTISQW